MRKLLVGLVIFPFLAGCGENGVDGPKTPPPPEVKFALATSEVITDYEDFTGRTEAVKMVEVRARATGFLEKVNFKDGDMVVGPRPGLFRPQRPGQVLFEIDARPYKAAWDRAVSTVKEKKASKERLTKEFERADMLIKQPEKGISQQEYDKAISDLAEVVAALEVAEANVVTAKINLDFTRVTAPLSGRISRRLQDPGNLIKADDTLLTTIVAVEPIYAYFAVDERTVNTYKNLRQKTGQDDGIPFWLGLAGEENAKPNLRGWEGFPHPGKVDFAENKIDAGTGTLMLRGLLHNPKAASDSDKPQDYLFTPGLFVRVRLEIGKPKTAVLVPEVALGTDQGQKFVYVINAKNEADYRPIEIGAPHGDRRVILKGVEAGEKIIVSGLQRVRKDDKKVTPLPVK